MNGQHSTFEEFWPFYVSQHLHPVSRKLHFVGTTLALLTLAAGLVLCDPWIQLSALILGYGPAWAGHFFFEKNRPATFRYAFMSLRADFRMWWYTLTNQMDAELLLLMPKIKALRAEK